MQLLPGLTVMARWSAPRRCKRRLTNDLSQQLQLQRAEDRAARIQSRLTAHTLAVASSLRRTGHLDLTLAVSGLAPMAAQRWGRALGADQVCLQSGTSLGSRMRHLLLRMSRQHKGCPALLIGSDLPSLSRQDLLQAIERLGHHELVLGPSVDGGYWLIGMAATLMQRPQVWPLSGIAWGTNRVLQQTEVKAKAHGLSVDRLRTQRDLDHLSDLGPWLS